MAREGFEANDDQHFRCAWVSSGGERCHDYGGISSSGMHRNSADVPWYCLGHYDCGDAQMGDRLVELSRRLPRGGDPVSEARERYLTSAGRTPGARAGDAVELVRVLARQLTDAKRVVPADDPLPTDEYPLEPEHRDEAEVSPMQTLAAKLRRLVRGTP